MRTMIAMFLLVMGLSAQTIPGSPSTEKCYADLNDFNKQHAQGKPVLYADLLRLSAEIGYCTAHSPDGLQKNSLQMLETGFQDEKEQRMFHFLVRHKLLDKFIEEDKAGLR